MIAPAKARSRGRTGWLLLAVVVLVLLPALIRAFLLEAFKIPAGSMIPSILVGDHIFVNKSAYGLRLPFTDTWLMRGEAPARGEVIVFKYPRDPKKDYIKRIVAVGGDSISVDGEAVFVNGRALARSGPEPYEHIDAEEDAPPVKRTYRLWHETAAVTARSYSIVHAGTGGAPLEVPGRSELPGLECRSPAEGEERGVCKVLPGFLFVLGDNRDNSSDSRVWGGVPVDFVKGRAWIVWFSETAGRIGKVID